MNKEKQKHLLQKNLLVLRTIAGWSAEELGKRTGISKQAISDLENIKRTMSLTQYLAIRSAISEEIGSNSENEILGQVLDILVDKGAELDDEKYSEIQNTIKAVMDITPGGKKGSLTAKKVLELLTSPGAIIAIGALVGMLSQSSTTKK